MYNEIKHHGAAFCRVALLATVGLLPIVAMSACGNNADASLEQEEELGSVGLAITSPDGQVVNSVSYTVTNAAGAVVERDVVNVSNGNATVSVRLLLPVGTGYAVSMQANTTSGGRCTGSATFDVVKGATTPVELTLACDGGAAPDQGNVLINGTLGAACPRVLSQTAAPLVTSVGGSIALNGAASSADAVLTWSATSGTIVLPNAASTTFTCTEAGTAAVTLTVSKGTTCTDSKSVDVTCVVSMPRSLVITDCTASSICQIEQHGSAWKAVCNRGTTTLTGTVDKNTAQWSAADGSPCTAAVENGQLVGQCLGPNGTCALSSREAIPSPTCIDLPSQILFDGCGTASARCDVIQDACSWQASCNNGKVFGGTSRASDVRWTATDGSSCRTAANNGTLPAGALAGTCTPPRNATGAVACNFTTQRPADLPADPVCPQLASTFVLSGCGLDTQYADVAGASICRTVQNGCLWQASCGDVAIGGRATGATYSWTNSDGKKCSGSLTDGVLTGACSDAAGTCNFQQRAAAAPEGCQVVPASISIDGCGVQGSCTTIQDGCDWQARCNDAVVYNGIATATGLALLSHIDDAPFWCALNVDGSTISGGCTPYPVTEGAENLCSITGSVSSQ